MDAPTTRSPSTFMRRLKADLRRDKRKAKVLIGLVPLLVAALIPLLISGYPSKSIARPAQRPEPVADELPLVQVAHDLRTELAGLMQNFEGAQGRLWSGDDESQAFARLGAEDLSLLAEDAGLDAGNRIEQERRLSERLVLSATFLSSTRGNVAIIDGNPHREGGELESLVVLSIGVRSVVLRGLYGEYELRMPAGDGERK